jgi:protein arginine N-methyltransferase 2
MDQPQIDEEDQSYVQTQQVLLAAAHHDLEALRALLKTIPATVQDDETGYTPLHAAIAACVPDTAVSSNGTNGTTTASSLQHEETLALAEKTMRLLFQNGAIWNDLDAENETPGCLALRLGLMPLYEVMVDAGVRAELLMNRLDAYEPLGGDEDDEDDDEDVEIIDVPQSDGMANGSTDATGEDVPTIQINGEANGDESTESGNYLHSDLTFQDDRLVDSSNNGVMMEWESRIMEESVARLAPTSGQSVLNIGHGMAIIDSMFQAKSPAAHHIIEAHPQVLEQMQQTGWRSSDEATSTSTKYPGVTVHAGKWQDILPQLITAGTTFDCIYFDTFAEDYKAFRHFFEELVIGLLKPGGRWSFFNGMGADRQVCYDVYTKVVEMDLFEAGFDIEWTEVETKEAEREGEWQGLRRRYWALDKYRLPVCTFVA